MGGALSGGWSSVWVVYVELCLGGGARLVGGALSGWCMWSSVWWVELSLVGGALSGGWSSVWAVYVELCLVGGALSGGWSSVWWVELVGGVCDHVELVSSAVQ